MQILLCLFLGFVFTYIDSKKSFEPREYYLDNITYRIMQKQEKLDIAKQNKLEYIIPELKRCKVEVFCLDRLSRILENEFTGNKNKGSMEHFVEVNSKKIKFIYDEFRLDQKGYFPMFMAHALHNTDFFKEMESKDDAMYRSRGLLQIQGKDNYKKLQKIVLDMVKKNQANKDVNYMKNPGSYSELSFLNIKVTVKWFMDHIITPLEKEKGISTVTYMDTLKKLNPEEVQGENIDKNDHEYKLEQRKKIYLAMEMANKEYIYYSFNTKLLVQI